MSNALTTTLSVLSPATFCAGVLWGQAEHGLVPLHWGMIAIGINLVGLIGHACKIGEAYCLRQENASGLFTCACDRLFRMELVRGGLMFAMSVVEMVGLWTGMAGGAFLGFGLLLLPHLVMHCLVANTERQIGLAQKTPSDSRARVQSNREADWIGRWVKVSNGLTTMLSLLSLAAFGTGMLWSGEARLSQLGIIGVGLGIGSLLANVYRLYKADRHALQAKDWGGFKIELIRCGVILATLALQLASIWTGMYYGALFGLGPLMVLHSMVFLELHERPYYEKIC